MYFATEQQADLFKLMGIALIDGLVGLNAQGAVMQMHGIDKKIKRTCLSGYAGLRRVF